MAKRGRCKWGPRVHGRCPSRSAILGSGSAGAYRKWVKERARGHRVLSPGSKSIIDNMVGRLHVGESDEKVCEYVLSRIKQQADAWFKKAACEYAKKSHHRNLKLYLQVQRGIF